MMEHICSYHQWDHDTSTYQRYHNHHFETGHINNAQMQTPATPIINLDQSAYSHRDSIVILFLIPDLVPNWSHSSTLCSAS